jgi:thiamine transport system substrate-binding protein
MVSLIQYPPSRARHAALRGPRSAAPRIVLAAALFLIALRVFPGGGAQAVTKTGAGSDVVVWTYDSFVSEWGPGPQAAEKFFEKTGVKVRFVSRGDGGALLARLLSEGKNADADVVLGLDQNLAPKALASGLFQSYKPAGAELISKELLVDKDFTLTPFDYGYFSIIYDSQKIAAPPSDLEDLTKPEYQKRLILMDPRTSTPGMGFFSWTREVYGDGWADYWRRLRPSILTVAEGWDTGYGLFTAGEAPMVLSYTTSPAYHSEYEQSERYKAAIFAQGHPVQIELAGLLRAAPRAASAKLFMDFILSDTFQSLIPLTNWMYPVRSGTNLPDSYRMAPKSPKTLTPASPTEKELAEWVSLMTEK